MAVRSRSSTSFVFGKRRFASIDSADLALHEGDEFRQRLELSNVDRSNKDQIVFEYTVPYEPYLDPGKDQFTICSDIALLDATITGVDPSEYTVEWQQLSGIGVQMDTPTQEDTLVTKAPNDFSDKVFHIKVVNKKTGVINNHRLTLYGTPTDVAIVDAGKEAFIDYSATVTLSGEALIPEPPKLGVPYTGRQIPNPSKYIVWNLPSFTTGLIRVEIYENYRGKYELLGLADPSTLRYELPKGRETAAYKLRFIYNLNGFTTSKWSTKPVYIPEDGTLLLVEDVQHLSGMSGGYTYDEIRQKLTKRLVTDVKVGFNDDHPSFNYSTLRITKIAKQVSEEYIFTVYGGNFLFTTDLQRVDRDVIGGG